MFASLYGDGCFLSLSELAGESTPLPKPRKISPSNSASVLPKASKRKVAPLAPPRVTSTRNASANDASYERTSSEHVSKARCSASAVENTTLPNKDTLVARVEREETVTTLSNKDASSDKDGLNERKEISKAVDDVTVESDDASSKANRHPNREMGSNFELHSNSVEPTEAEEISPVFKEKSSNSNELARDRTISNIVDAGSDASCTEQSVSSEQLPLPLERKVMPRKEESNVSEQIEEIKSESLDFQDDSETDDHLNENVIGLDHVTEARNEQVKLSSYPERPPRVSRKIVSICDIERNVEAAEHVHSEDAINDATAVKGSLGKDRETCTVISTIPKCEHIDAVKEGSPLNTTAKRDVASTDHRFGKRSRIGRATKDDDEAGEKRRRNDQSEESNGGAKSAKRTKVVRSQSKSDDFETDPLKRHRRHFTSPPENIVYALNLNLPARDSTSSSVAQKEPEQIVAGQCTNRTKDMDVDKGESSGGLVAGACCNITNILL